MATYTKELLSGSTDGKQIKIAATATAGTLLHTADVTDLDEIWLYFVNSGAVPVKVTIEWGEATAPDGHIEFFVQPESGYVNAVAGLPLTNSLEVRAFAGTADVVMASGYVNRIAP